MSRGKNASCVLRGSIPIHRPKRYPLGGQWLKSLSETWLNFGCWKTASATHPANNGVVLRDSSNLFASQALAEELLSACREFESRILQLLLKSEQSEPENEHREFKLAVGHVVSNLGDRFLYPVYRRHSALVPDDLKGELDSSANSGVQRSARPVFAVIRVLRRAPGDANVRPL